MHLEFEGAYRVGNALDIVAQAMGEIVHRINAPFAAGMMMFGVANAVENRVPQPYIRRRHVNFGTQRPRAVGELTGLHALKEIEILGHWPVAKRTFLARTVR